MATLSRLARVVAGPLQAAVLVARMAELERTRERFTERAIAAQEAERSRLASDIHDGISQRLVSLSYHLDAAGGLLLSDPGLAAEQIRTAQQLAAAPNSVIQAYAPTNSIIITAAEPVYRALRSVIDALDQRRPFRLDTARWEGRLYQIPTAMMFAQAIRRTHEEGGSISDLLK